MPGSILGTRVLRTEDPALLTGSARYLNDLDLPGKLHAVFARSEVAHARLSAVHIDDALAVPGVVAVLTAETLGVPPHHGFVAVHPDFARPPLATDTVRFVGEAIAIVVAETVTAAADGAAAVWADYEPLDPIIDPEAPSTTAPRRSSRITATTRRWSRPTTTSTSRASATSWSGAATSTSASPSCRWRRTAARRSRATTGG